MSTERPDPALDSRLARLLGGPDLAWLLDRARRRLERGRPLTGAVTRAQATAQERAALAGLLGRRVQPGTALTVRFEAVDDLLRRSGVHVAGLASAVVVLTGPVRDLTAESAADVAAWDEAFAVVHALADRRPELAGWVARLRSGGVLRRLAPEPVHAGRLLGDVVTALDSLPTVVEPMGRFAERVLGSAHALDDDRPVTTLVFAAARELAGIGAGSGAAWRRSVWRAVGLHRDEVSSTVLTLGLRGDARTGSGRMLRAGRDVGQPVVLTLRQLLGAPPALDLAGAVVSLCENPVVLESAADRLGGASPLVCVSGQPGLAVTALLEQLHAAGARLRYHGDFDWGGLRIANRLWARLPMTPWRFDTENYLRWCGPTQRELSGPIVPAAWDQHLAGAMAAHGRAVEEERVCDDLLDDLAGAAQA